MVSDAIVRPAIAADLPALTDLYNHYIRHTPITFDLQPFTVEGRRAWFEQHALTGRHRLLVADAASSGLVGYASSSLFRPKAAYATTVEASVYCRADCIQQGI